MQAKIKIAQDMKVPYMLIVGGKDETSGSVSVRERTRGDLGAIPLATFVERAVKERDTHGKEVVNVG